MVAEAAALLGKAKTAQPTNKSNVRKAFSLPISQSLHHKLPIIAPVFMVISVKWSGEAKTATGNLNPKRHLDLSSQLQRTLTLRAKLDLGSAGYLVLLPQYGQY